MRACWWFVIFALGDLQRKTLKLSRDKTLDELVELGKRPRDRPNKGGWGHWIPCMWKTPSGWSDSSALTASHIWWWCRLTLANDMNKHGGIVLWHGGFILMRMPFLIILPKKFQFLSTKAQMATQNHKGFWAWMQLEERWGCGALLLCCVCLSAWLYYVGDVPLQICHLVSADHTAERRLNLPLWKSKYTPTRDISQMFLIKRGKKRKTKLESIPSRILSCCYVTGVFWVIAAVLLLDTKISK